ncbi:MAG: penicillin-binding protein activator LpoB [Ramlibacter sp.]|nr:penicillin-binding protein activator LpoB [Ramlibacter sp.]MBX3659640.1 penicillin-binding protein activator LpoB [Ramlibacter sp.]MCW5651297.1 penicillin-binding protein activator LpoB [Ramlibacter sp.]
MKTPRLISILLSAAVLAACGVLGPGGQGSSGRSAMAQAIAAGDKVALLPVANFTDVPQAGLRVEALLEPALRQAGLRQLVLYPPALNPETLFEPGERKAQAEAEKWARTQGVRYVVSGAVNEWRYKVGVDGEPAVGLMLQVKDLSNDQVVYSSAGGRTGGSRQALAAVGQQLAAELVSGIRVEPTGRAAATR